MFPGMLEPDSLGLTNTMVTTTNETRPTFLPGFVDVFTIDPSVQTTSSATGDIWPQTCDDVDVTATRPKVSDDPMQHQSNYGGHLQCDQSPTTFQFQSFDDQNVDKGELLAEFLGRPTSDALRQALSSSAVDVRPQNDLTTTPASDRFQIDSQTTYHNLDQSTSCQYNDIFSSAEMAATSAWTSSSPPQYHQQSSSTTSHYESLDNIAANFQSGLDPTGSCGGGFLIDPISGQCESSYPNHRDREDVKRGLKYHIQTKMIATGRDPLTMEHHLSTGRTTPTYEDEERQKLRRERNKVAATKCRKKKQAKTVQLTHEERREEVKRDDLKFEIDQLKRQHDHLKHVLDTHNPACRLLNNQRHYSSAPS
ncbi:Uncharacterised protein g8998 [Pycnogonum litorale]